MQKKHDKARIGTYDLPHAALNPGASYRGLHDSIVKWKSSSRWPPIGASHCPRSD
jgi:hypothetical protein